MARFRKRPVEVEAFHLSSYGACAWPTWAVTHENILIESDFRGNVTGVIIETLEGDMRAAEGDWIVRGVKGEIYPVKLGVFADTYEPVEHPSSKEGETR